MTKQQNDGSWVEYDLASLIAGHTEEARIVRVFSSEVAALRSAVASGNRVIRVQFGETIQEALARAENAKSAAPAKRARDEVPGEVAG